MKKLITAIVAVPLVVIGVMPPVCIPIPITDSKLWLWLVLMAGFLGFSTLWLRISPFVKFFSVYGFINIFFTSMPFISQWAYIQLIACIYYYWACVNCEDTILIRNILWTVLGINLFMLTTQFFHKDNLLNFGLDHETCYGIIGNSMQFKSFVITLTALLLSYYKISKTWLIRIYIFLFIVCVIYFFQHQVYSKFLFTRAPVWYETIRLSLQRPIAGWGMGSFKTLFPTLSNLPMITKIEGGWFTAHNDFLQIFFETGIIGLTAILAYVWSALRRYYILPILLVLFTMTFHMPMRTFGCVPFLILFIANIERKENVTKSCSVI